MQTNAEFLKDKDNQIFIREKIVSMLRSRGLWGKRGLFASMAKDMGLSAAYVGRILTGKQPIAEDFLVKLAVHFEVSVPWLRDGAINALDRLLEGLKIKGINADSYNKTMADILGKDEDYWGDLIAGRVNLNPETIGGLCKRFGIDEYWVTTGREPTILTRSGIVGTVQQWDHEYDKIPALGPISDDKFNEALNSALNTILDYLHEKYPEATKQELMQAITDSKNKIKNQIENATP